jgi:SAM-dependent methyltransferase
MMQVGADKADVVEFKDSTLDEIWAGYRRSGISGMINSYNLCNALFALASSGAVDRLDAEDFKKPEELLQGLDAHLGTNLLRYLRVQGVLEEQAGTFRTTGHGAELLSDVALAQLGFYRGAYGPVFDKMPQLLRGELRYGPDVQRDGAALGKYSAVLFHRFHTPIVLEGVRRMNATQILDLGCGAGRALIDACRKNPDIRGVGLDISDDVIGLARRTAEESGFSDRLRFVVGDAFRPQTWPAECHSADAILAVGVMHEHFREGESAVIGLLNVFADLLEAGKLKGMLLGEPELRYDAEDNDPDFYLAHIFTNQGFPRAIDGWLELFEKTRLRCRRVLRRPDSGPRLVFYDLVARHGVAGRDADRS